MRILQPAWRAEFRGGIIRSPGRKLQSDREGSKRTEVSPPAIKVAFNTCNTELGIFRNSTGIPTLLEGTFICNSFHSSLHSTYTYIKASTFGSKPWEVTPPRFSVRTRDLELEELSRNCTLGHRSSTITPESPDTNTNMWMSIRYRRFEHRGTAEPNGP
jgi:hypothetical protein